MEYEYNEGKSAANKQKHGIDFIEAQELWNDPDLLEIPARSTEDESRYIIIGQIGTRMWSAIVTYRDDKIRIISVRSSRSEEKYLYES